MQDEKQAQVKRCEFGLILTPLSSFDPTLALLDTPLLQHSSKGRHSGARADQNHGCVLSGKLHHTWLNPHRHLQPESSAWRLVESLRSLQFAALAIARGSVWPHVLNVSLTSAWPDAQWSQQQAHISHREHKV